MLLNYKVYQLNIALFVVLNLRFYRKSSFFTFLIKLTFICLCWIVKCWTWWFVCCTICIKIFLYDSSHDIVFCTITLKGKTLISLNWIWVFYSLRTSSESNLRLKNMKQRQFWTGEIAFKEYIFSYIMVGWMKPSKSTTIFRLRYVHKIKTIFCFKWRSRNIVSTCLNFVFESQPQLLFAFLPELFRIMLNLFL